MDQEDQTYCIVGTSGFARETLTCLLDMVSAQRKSVNVPVVFMETDEKFQEPEVMGVPVIKQSDFDPKIYRVVVAIGDPKQRRKVVDNLPENTCYATIIHPSAVVSKWVTVGEGSIITAGTILTCNIELGRHCHLNLHSTVGHDCKIGDYFTTAPGVNISGICHFGNCVYFGTNAAVKQGIEICDNVTIGMGGVVVKDINESGIYVGNPVKKLIH